jgi:hypothetical protein
MIQNFAIKSKGSLPQDSPRRFAERFTIAREHPIQFIRPLALLLRFQQT